MKFFLEELAIMKEKKCSQVVSHSRSETVCVTVCIYKCMDLGGMNKGFLSFFHF